MKKKNFTLVEIMIVVAIIALLAAIAIPNLLRSRLSAQEASAAASMKAICAAELAWRTSHNSYASFANLINANPSYLDAGFAIARRAGEPEARA